MDRSFLSHPDVIAASRKFVCARLATYESAREAELLKTIFTGRTGELENTVFCLLSPDGKQKLVSAGRSPRWAFQGPEDWAARSMAHSMNTIATHYKAEEKPMNAPHTLPAFQDFRLALNIAACDNLPLVVIFAKSEQARQDLERQVAELAWNDHFVGHFTYVSVRDPSVFTGAKAVSINEGVIIIQSGTYGLTGDVLVQVNRNDATYKLKQSLMRALTLHKPEPKDPRSHIATGRRLGVNWQTKIPVTDRGPRGRPNRRR